MISTRRSRPGGQPGHKGHKRELLEPDEVVAVRPARCSCSGKRLRGEDPAPRRHQVVDLPPVKPHVHPDGTGWREHGQRRWLWTATTGKVAVVCIDRSRGADVAKRLLGEDFAGVTVSDRWYGYNWLDVQRRQLCWAHLNRDFQDFVERGDARRRIGLNLLRNSKKMFRWWHRV